MGKIIGPASIIVDLAAYADHLPIGGETVMSDKFRIGPGGKGSNQMTAAARAGAEAVIIGKIGRDVLGNLFEQHYADNNMTMKHIGYSDDAATGTALIEVEAESGQNRIIVIPGASNEVTGADVLAAEEDFRDADVVLFQFETSYGSIVEAKRLAKKYGKRIVLNSAPYVDYPRELYDGIDYVTPNETEAEAITGVHIGDYADARKAAEILLGMGVKKAIVTMGTKGSYFYDGVNEYVFPCLPYKAVETTGAGDAFSGGLSAALAEGLDDYTALQFATCTSNLAITRPGSSTSMPYRAEILEAMKQHYGVEL